MPNDEWYYHELQEEVCSERARSQRLETKIDRMEKLYDDERKAREIYQCECERLHGLLAEVAAVPGKISSSVEAVKLMYRIAAQGKLDGSGI